MSDLSRLLGDVYGSSDPPGEDEAPPAAGGIEPAAPEVTRAPQAHPERDLDDPPEALVELGPEPAPGWADDRLLDEAFADWIPGPGPHAADLERGLVESPVDPAEDVPTTALPALDDDADRWLLPGGDPPAEHAVVAPGDAGPEDGASPVADDGGPWTRAADDLLPVRGRTRRLALRRR